MQESLFDRGLLRLNYHRSAREFANYSFLHDEVANRIEDNLAFFNKNFEKVLKIQRDQFIANGYEIRADDEFLPFKNNSFDLIISNLNFHFINQIPQFLIQVKNLLKPGGVFIASFFGEENLSELRQVLYEVENKIYGGISPRIAPTIDVKTAAALIQKAGFTNPISTLETIKIEYSGVDKLLKDLKMMGQGNIMHKRSRKFATRRFFEEISKKYHELYQTSDSKLLASFDIVTVIGVSSDK
jgi:SAM-dependent methyltransferase